ncbi:MAG: shikimate dehydrogenase [Thermoplasmata archaeon]
MTRIVASLVERSVSGVSRSSKEAFRQGADLVEVRLDHLSLKKVDARTLSGIREAVRGPAIATLRSSMEGGRSRLRGDAREKALRAVLGAGFEYVDLELDTDRRLLKESRGKGQPHIIASCHFAAPAPTKEVGRALDRACGAGDIGKVAMPCDDAGQALTLAALGMRRSARGDEFDLIGMGDQGQLTRVCARQIGSAMVYCCLHGKPAAPGQLDVRSQSSLWRRDGVVLGLLGHPVSHSVSKPMQEAALRAAGIPGVYLNLDVPPKALTRNALDTFRELGFSGLNVTIPHKESARSACDRLDPEAASAGAVNTVIFDGPNVYGKNTDIIGFTEALESKKHIVPNAEALIIGAGGVARAAALSLGRAGAHVTVAARSPERGERMAEELGSDLVSLDSLRRAKRSYDVIVNCTPVGTKGLGGAVPIPSSLFKRGVLYFDTVYNPPVTKTMKLAMARKATAVSGLEMLVRQGAASFKSWTGAEPDLGAMRSAARRALP